MRRVITPRRSDQVNPAIQDNPDGLRKIPLSEEDLAFLIALDFGAGEQLAQSLGREVVKQRDGLELWGLHHAPRVLVSRKAFYDVDQEYRWDGGGQDPGRSYPEEALRLCQLSQVVKSGNRCGAASGFNDALALQMAQDSNGCFDRRVRQLRELVLRQGDGGAKFLRERHEGLREPSFDRVVDHTAFVLNFTQTITKEAQGILKEIRVLL